MKFDIDKIIKWELILINTNILKYNYDLSEDRTKKIITSLKKKWLLYKVNKGNYITINWLQKIDRFKLSMLLVPTGYIWLYSVLEKRIIKQSYIKTYILTNNNINKNNILFNKFNLEVKKTNIWLNFWINIINNIRYSDTERALLDLIYFHVFNGFPILSELYLEWNLDYNKINKYLEYYPNRVKSFYKNKLYNYVK